ncbi:MAG: hypothetical protein K8R09_05185 [Desulfobacterales bacterium]|nr:hypothetical protein [Desulfobacterales bacterium]MCD4787590.1 hypothetical protein [Desulfobacterales bacterium]
MNPYFISGVIGAVLGLKRTCPECRVDTGISCLHMMGMREVIISTLEG